MAKDLTSFNTGYLDSLLLDYDNSPFDYKGFHATSHYSQDHIDYPLQNTLTAGFGQTAEIWVPQGEYFIGKLQLTFTVSAFALSGAATYARLHDFGAYHCIDNITCKYGNVDLIVPQIESDDLVIRYNLDYGTDERLHVDQNIGANLSQFERNAAVSSAQNMLIELPLQWSISPNMYVNMNALNKPLIFKIKFKGLPDAIETNTTNPSTDVTATISNVLLRVFTYTQPDDILKRQTGVLSSKVNKNGILKKTVYREKIENYPIPTGTTTIMVPLSGIKGNVIEWFFILRLASQISAGSANQDYLTYQDIQQWELYDGQTLIIRAVTSQYNRMYLIPHWHPGVPGNYIFGFSYSMQPTDVNNSTGHLNHGSFKNPQLKIYFNATTTNPIRFDFFATSHQFLQQKDDTFRPLFE